MSNLVQLQNGYKAYGRKTLFDHQTFSINEGEHVGVIGPNGAGKTTLFRTLIGNESLDSGEWIRSGSLRLGYLAQEETWSPETTARDYVGSTSTRAMWTIEELGRNIGMDEVSFNTPMVQLSGGFRMRAKLLKMIGLEPNLMLLDEPTNYLDLESVMMLEEFLADYEGAFLLISHDRRFLNQVCAHTLEVESGQLNKFPGPLEAYFEYKKEKQELLEKEAKQVESERKHLEDFVRRFGAKATKASQAQSRVKKLQKLKKVEIPPLPVSAKIRLPEPIRTGRKVVSFGEIDLGYGDKKVLGNVNFEISRGDRFGVVGVNGAGKSTLLKGISREIEPQNGRIDYGLDVSVAYYAQHVSDKLNPEFTVFQELTRASHPKVTQQDVLDLAGALLFSGDDVYKQIDVLSGGEKARVALGQVLLKKAPLLVLDEPTNHLDFQTVEALTLALKEYPGTTLLVSHDRDFISRACSKILEIRDGGAHPYPGTYEEYVWHVQNTLRSSPPETFGEDVQNNQSKKAKPANNENLKHRRKKLQGDIRDLKKKIRSTETRIETLEEEILSHTEELSQLSGKEAQSTSIMINELQKELQEREKEWENSGQKLHDAQEELESIS